MDGKISFVRAFKDNYIWLIETAPSIVWAIDPGVASPVISLLQQSQYQLGGILLTHHHHDHSGGIPELLDCFPSIDVVASHHSKIPSVTKTVKEGDVIHCQTVAFQILDIPGHTLDHIAFYTPDILFCGDTLFSAGCGRVFEGTYEQMYQSLMKLKSLPDTTRIFCGHEYTLNNLLFAETVEPTNLCIQAKIASVKAMLEKGEATLPSQISDEKMLNPFFRCEEKNVQEKIFYESGKSITNPEEIFQFLREWKNRF